MKAVYAETSAILAWLFGEGNAEETISVLNRAEYIVTSVLTEIEVRRSLVRATSTGLLTEATSAHLLGVFETVHRAWSVMAMSDTVRARAAMRFPIEPVRSLDAIHPATALEFTKEAEGLRVLSFDPRITDNVTPLGLVSATPA